MHLFHKWSKWSVSPARDNRGVQVWQFKKCSVCGKTKVGTL